MAGNANLVAGNIKKGTNIFGVTGTYEGNLSGDNIFIFNNNYTNISTSYFYAKRNSGLTIANFPFVTQITHSSAFKSCSALVEFYPNKTAVTTLTYSTAFSGINSNCKFYVPSNMLNSYKTATNWTYYSTKFVAY